MARKNFYDIIKSKETNILREYQRLYNYVFESDDNSIALALEDNFEFFPKSFRGRTSYLYDFDITYRFDFDKYEIPSTERFLLFCEYVTNLLTQLEESHIYDIGEDDLRSIDYVHETIAECIDELNYTAVKRDNITIFVEKSPEAIAVAEIVTEEISFDVLRYNHFSLKGDLKQKRAILKLFVDDIENKSTRSKLKSINGTLESQLYQLMNKFVRHDHSQTPEIEKMSDEELEAWYDDIYQMWLLAKLELDNLDRKKEQQSCCKK